MPHSGRFDAAELADGWRGYERLAYLCVLARLTRRQAHVLLLHCRGFTQSQTAKLLGLRNRQAVHQAHWRAVRQLAAFLPEPRSRSLQWARDLLAAVRNVGLGGEPPRVLYDIRGCPVGCRAKPFGAVPEDLVSDALDPAQQIEAWLDDYAWAAAHRPKGRS